MKKIYKLFLSGIAAILCTTTTAQVSAYMFAQSNGTYIPITGGTVIATATANTAPANLGGLTWNLPNGTFPFTFKFNGIGYTGCNISCNGYISFGTVTPTSGSPISATTAYDGCVAAWGRTTNGVFGYTASASPTSTYTSELRIEVIGVAPNRTVVIQFDNWRYSSGTTAVTWLHDWQIRLCETTNVVEIVYGEGVMANGNLTTSGFNCQVGLRGATNADFNNRSSFGLFNQSTAGTANNASQVIGVTSGVGIFMPPTGLIYRWHPPCFNASVATPTIGPASILLCEGDTVNLNAAGATPYFDISYQWKVSGTPGGPYSNVSGATMFDPYTTIGVPGIYFYILTTTCPSNSASATSNEIIVDVRPLPVLSILTTPALNTTVNPIEVCFAETYTLQATGASTHTWMGNPPGDINIIQPFTNTSYTVTGISVDGCVSSKVWDILVNPLPLITTIATPTAICPGQPVVIGATGNAVTYTWTSPYSTSFLITVSPTITTTYPVLGTSVKGCTNMATQQVIVKSLPPLYVVPTPTICKGEEVTLSATGANTYTWVASTTYTTGATISVSPKVTTTYTITAAGTNGCSRQTTIEQVVEECTGLKDMNGNFTRLAIYPNPNNGVFTVELNNGAIKTLELMDITGKMVHSITTENNKTELSINELASGVYYLRVQSNNAVEVIKVIKQ
jgi:hypothetical protein